MFLQLALALPVILILEYLLYRKYILKGVSYQRTFSQVHVFEGEKVNMVEVIENNSLLPIPWLKAEARLGPYFVFGESENLETVQGGYHRSVFSIMPFYKIKRTHEITCTHRGDFQVGTVTITSGDILGFISKIKTYDNNISIIVYPTPLDNKQLTKCFSSLQGDVVVRRFINADPFMVAGVRDYAPGDPMYSINWKATAKTDSMQVYKYDFTSNSNILFLFNIDTCSEQGPFPNEQEAKMLEFAIRFCASAVKTVIEMGIAAGFCSNAHYRDSTEFINIASRCSKTQMYTIFEALGRMQLNRTISFNTMLHKLKSSIPKNTDIVVISLYVDDTLQEELTLLRRGGFKVEVWNLSDSMNN